MNGIVSKIVCKGSWIFVMLLLTSYAKSQLTNEDFKLAPNNLANELFGVAVSVDDGVIATGAIGNSDFGESSGCAYLHQASTGNYIAKLRANDSSQGDEFGASIDIHNGIVVVGAPGDDDNGDESGSVYVFDVSSGTQLYKLLPTDGAADDRFGVAVAIFNNTIAVGATGDGQNGIQSGSVYLFDVVSGVQVAKLLAEDGAPNDLFGGSVDLDSGKIVAGATGDDDLGTGSGSAYVFDITTGTQLAKILPESGASGDQFGISTAIQSNLVVVGATGTDFNGAQSGSAYVFESLTGVQLAALRPDDGSVGDHFGISVAINNGTVAVGSHHDRSREPSRLRVLFDDNVIGPKAGSVFLFDALTGNQLSKLFPSFGMDNDLFGYSVALKDGLVVIGSCNHDSYVGIDSGSTYIFDQFTGTQIRSIKPFADLLNNLFGIAVSINNDIIAVGAPHDKENGHDSGSVYIFERSTGRQIAKLNPEDARPYDRFGGSLQFFDGIVAITSRNVANGTGLGAVYFYQASTGFFVGKINMTGDLIFETFGAFAIDDDLIAIGSPLVDGDQINSGAAFLFSISTGDLLMEFRPEIDMQSGYFGSSVALKNGILGVGAIKENGNANSSGSAYLYDTATGEMIYRLIASDGTIHDSFGSAIAINDKIIVVGASDAAGDVWSNSGAIYMYDLETGIEIAKIAASDGHGHDSFGSKIAIDKNLIAVGVSQANVYGSRSGAAYLFSSNTGDQITKLVPSDGTADARFGSSISINDGIVAVGATRDPVGIVEHGSVYLFDFRCYADIEDDDQLNFLDVSAFLVAFAEQDSVADFTSDGSFNFLDVSAFFQAFIAGCP